VQSRGGLTPLFTLPGEESAALEMARFLLEHGADPTIRGPSGDTPAGAAHKLGFESLAALLRARR